jgi:hypothetical protein
VGNGAVLGGLVKRIVDRSVAFPLGNPPNYETLK